MADKKISQLSAASLPLAGTEVLPIVQSSATVKIASDNLTVKNIRSNATSGILQVAGPAAASTRVMTVPDANFSAARIDAAQSFTGDQTLSTGNLIVGTSGKGIDFSASPNPGGMTSELLADYEEGAWTPTLNGITPTDAGGTYTKIGRLVSLDYFVVFPTTASSADALIGSLPFLIRYGTAGSTQAYGTYTSAFVMVASGVNSITVQLRAIGGATILPNSTFSGLVISGTIMYHSY